MATTLSLDDGLRVLDGLESVRLRVKQRLLFNYGEYIGDTAAGIPYLAEILGRNLEPEIMGVHIGYYVNQVEDVNAVRDIFVRQNRRSGELEIDMTLETPFGETRLGVVIGGASNV